MARPRGGSLRLLAHLLALTTATVAHATPRPRLAVFTDIGGDPDDQQSLVRLLFYANELELEAIYAGSRLEHGDDPRPELVLEILDGYAKVLPALRRHDSRYPSASQLRARVHAGRPGPRRDRPVLIGAGHDTPASRHAAQLFQRANPRRPLHVAIWGGATDFAQALDELQRRNTAEAFAKILAGLRVYAIGDQDGAGAFVKAHHPSLFYVEGAWRFDSLYRGMYQNDSAKGLPLVAPEVAELNQQAWVEANIVAPCPELGRLYPTSVVQNPSTERNRRGVKEGDTPSWLYVLPTGLGDPSQPTWGSWGGRFRAVSGGLYQDAEDDHWSGSTDVPLRRKWTVARWREHYQNDFAARARWCSAAPRDANHPPKVQVAGSSRRTVRAGDRLTLDARRTTDPDRDPLTFAWTVYREPSSHKDEVSLGNARTPVVTLVAPRVTRPETIHVLLTVTDGGSPPTTRYARVVVTVTP